MIISCFLLINLIIDLKSKLRNINGDVIALRVIAGIYRGRKLAAPPGEKTRPTSGKVREAVFNIVAPHLPSCDSFLDLFAGSGAVGIEALSRSINRCVFVENSSQALKALKKNLEFCAEKEFEILPVDVYSALQKLKTRKFDIIYIDPPYDIENLLAIAEKAGGMLSEAGIMVIELTAKKSFPVNIGCLFNYKATVYGNTKVLFYKMKPNITGG